MKNIFQGKTISLQSLGQSAGNFWIKYFKLFLAIFFLGMILAGAYFWYQGMYQAGWSEDQKRNYASSQFQEKNLKEEAFNKVVEWSKFKKESFAKDPGEVKDIFKPW